MTRVGITGAGVVSSIGTGCEEFFEGIESGTRGIDRIRAFDSVAIPNAFGAEVRRWGKSVVLPRGTDRKAIFMRLALQELYHGSENINQYAPSRRRLVLGTGIDYFDLESYIDSGDAIGGSWQSHIQRSCDAVRTLAGEFNITGGYTVNVAACVASSQAIGLSYRMLQSQPDLAVIAGGFDSMINNLHFMGFHKLGALSQWTGHPSEACRPFDRKRCGLVIGEGAAVLLLQEISQARTENILAEIVGYSATMDAYQVTDPDPKARELSRAANEAIAQASISPQDIDCVHLHGTGTVKNAPAEAKAMEIVFGPRFRDIPVFSLKGQVGHLIGACGAIELLAAIYCLQMQRVYPTINYQDPDPEVPLNVVRERPLDIPIRYILKLNSAFGGQNTAIVLKAYEP